MRLLTFQKVSPAMATSEWKGITADDAPPGVYTPNMSLEDRTRWKAKLVGVRDLTYRIDRKSIAGTTQLVVEVRGANVSPGTKKQQSRFQDRHQTPHSIKVSSNGPMYFDPKSFEELSTVVVEARRILAILDTSDDRTRAWCLGKIKAGRNPLED